MGVRGKAHIQELVCIKEGRLRIAHISAIFVRR